MSYLSETMDWRSYAYDLEKRVAELERNLASCSSRLDAWRMLAQKTADLVHTCRTGDTVHDCIGCSIGRRIKAEKQFDR